MFHSLDDYRDKNRDEKKEKDNRKTTDSYAGGKSSGISVENPEDDWLNNIRKNEGRNHEDFDKTKNQITLTIYKNGFIVNDEPFRPLNTPENKKFMEEVKRGYIPQELVNKGYKDLGIKLDDRSHDDYEPPKEEKKFQAFVGQGQSLGHVNTANLKINENISTGVDKSKPTCQVNIRLFNGTVCTEEFNLSSTLMDVYKFVEKKSGSHNFDLLDGFPPKPLTDKNKTIEQLKIMGSLLTQKVK